MPVLRYTELARAAGLGCSQQHAAAIATTGCSMRGADALSLW